MSFLTSVASRVSPVLLLLDYRVNSLYYRDSNPHTHARMDAFQHPWVLLGVSLSLRVTCSCLLLTYKWLKLLDVHFLLACRGILSDSLTHC